MGSDRQQYLQSVDQLQSHYNCTTINDVSDALSRYSDLAYKSDDQKRFSKPMVWIGIYIAVASMFCILPMVVDLLHGLRNRKLWFPCKYFTINAASLTVIAIAMKLPMDLNNSMPGKVDQSAKLGSMAFMCTIMANLLPSLSTMDNKELLTNIIALGVLVITLVVNVCIQINTGVLSYTMNLNPYVVASSYNSVAIIYVAMLMMLLIIYTCSSLAILKSKQILESKYQTCHESCLKDQDLQQTRRLTVEKLKQHVSNYWIMAATGSPQFVSACSATTSASGVICAISTTFHIIIMLEVRSDMVDFESDYSWSTSEILIIQFIGGVLGSIAPVSRFLASLGFKLSIKWIFNHIKVFKVECYWTQTLSNWKQSSVPSPFHNRKCKIVIQKFKILILTFLVGFQKGVVVTCKIIGLATIFFVILVFYCRQWLEAMLDASGIVIGKSVEQLEQNKDLGRYVLQLEEDMEFAERTLKGISKSVNRLIQQAEKQQPKHLLKLLEKSRGFEGVERYNSHHVPPLSGEESLDCWSLPLVTLTTIAISLPNIQNDIVDSLISSVSEGLVLGLRIDQGRLMLLEQTSSIKLIL